MTLPAVLFAIRWLIRDTFRQARARGVTGATLAATAVCTLLCLSVVVSGDPPEIPGEPWEDQQILPPAEAAKYPDKDRAGVFVPGGEMTLLFGAFHVKLERSRTIRFASWKCCYPAASQTRRACCSRSVDRRLLADVLRPGDRYSFVLETCAAMGRLDWEVRRRDVVCGRSIAVVCDGGLGGARSANQRLGRSCLCGRAASLDSFRLFLCHFIADRGDNAQHSGLRRGDRGSLAGLLGRELRPPFGSRGRERRLVARNGVLVAAEAGRPRAAARLTP